MTSNAVVLDMSLKYDALSYEWKKGKRLSHSKSKRLNLCSG